jgi:hypothetical protein
MKTIQDATTLGNFPRERQISINASPGPIMS